MVCGVFACLLLFSPNPSASCCDSMCRELLLQGGSSSSRALPGGKETDQTAELDNRGLLQLQEHVMKQQDQELESMEKAVISTKVGVGFRVEGVGRLVKHLLIRA